MQVAGALFAQKLEFSILDGQYYSARLIYLHEGEIAFNATYVAPADTYAEIKPMIDYSFSTFTLTK